MYVMVRHGPVPALHTARVGFIHPLHTPPAHIKQTHTPDSCILSSPTPFIHPQTPSHTGCSSCQASWSRPLRRTMARASHTAAASQEQQMHTLWTASTHSQPVRAIVE